MTPNLCCRCGRGCRNHRSWHTVMDALPHSTEYLDAVEQMFKLAQLWGSATWAITLKEYLLQGCARMVQIQQKRNPTWSLDRAQRRACGGIHENTEVRASTIPIWNSMRTFSVCAPFAVRADTLTNAQYGDLVSFVVRLQDSRKYGPLSMPSELQAPRQRLSNMQEMCFGVSVFAPCTSRAPLLCRADRQSLFRPYAECCTFVHIQEQKRGRQMGTEGNSSAGWRL